MKITTRGAVGCAKLRHFICMRCSNIWSELLKAEEMTECPDCRFPGVERLGMPTVTGFREGYYEHATADGVHASSMAQLEEAAEKEGNRIQDRGELHYAKHRHRWV